MHFFYYSIFPLPPSGETHPHMTLLAEWMIYNLGATWERMTGVSYIYLVTKGNYAKQTLHIQMTKISIYSLTFRPLKLWLFLTWYFSRLKAQCCTNISAARAVRLFLLSSLRLILFVFSLALYTQLNATESWLNQLWTQITSKRPVWNIGPRGLPLARPRFLH